MSAPSSVQPFWLPQNSGRSQQHIERQKFQALRITREVLATACHPVIFSSFGKESLALLALLKEFDIPCEAAYFELGVRPEKHEFARWAIAEMGSSITFLNPRGTVLVSGGTNCSLGYQISLDSGDEITIVGATFEDCGSQELSCAIQHGLIKTNSVQSYPWDVIISGRRRSDYDITVGGLDWDQPIFELKNHTRIVMPLLNWSDEDLYTYLAQRRVPLDQRRYRAVDTAIREHRNKSYSPDHLHCCCRCAAVPRGSKVLCPLSGASVTSFSGVSSLEYRMDGNVSPAVMF